jgi:hypothetical protein
MFGLHLQAAKNTEYGLELVHTAFTGEVGYPKHQFCEDAAHGPNVYSGTVVPAPVKEFWRAVPSVTKALC